MNLWNSWILYPLIIWSVFWKGMALWRAARLRHLGWYIALLIMNTAGIFEIIYLLATNKQYNEI
jgi:methionyl-tRNA synthetase